MEDLFEIKSSKKHFNANKVIISDTGYPYITRTGLNNGVRGYINEDIQYLNDGNTISFGQDTATIFYQNIPYFTGNRIKILKPSNINLNKLNQHFFISAMQKSFSGFSWGGSSFSVDILGAQKIKLPIKANQIDYDFMDAFIAELEAERIAELEAYLSVTGLKNYHLTAAEQQAVADFEEGGVIWREFKIGDLFEIKSSKKRFDANKISISDAGYPYIVRTGLNNGVSGYINEGIQYLNDGNTISFGQDTATIFYQSMPYFTGDKIKILKPSNVNFNKLNQHFFISAMKKSFSLFSWGGSSFKVNILGKQKIKLPFDNNQIDFSFINTFITAIQKLVIKDVVDYCDQKIKATKVVSARDK